MRTGIVYILASRKNGALYIGVTSDLPRRLWEHQNDLLPGHTSKYGIHRLVWFEEYDLIVDAIQREKSLKKYKREWKINLIEEHNPSWQHLHPETGEFVTSPFPPAHGLPVQDR